MLRRNPSTSTTHTHSASRHDAEPAADLYRETPSVHHHGEPHDMPENNFEANTAPEPELTTFLTPEPYPDWYSDPEPEPQPEANFSPASSIIFRVPEPAPSSAAGIEYWRQRVVRDVGDVRNPDEETDIGKDWVKVKIKRHREYPMSTIAPLYFVSVDDHEKYTKRGDWRKIRDGLYVQEHRGTTYYTTTIPQIVPPRQRGLARLLPAGMDDVYTHYVGRHLR